MWKSSTVLLALGVGALAACSANVEAYDSASEARTSHAAIVIQRHSAASDPGHASATAFAGFIEVPGGVDPQQALHVVGFQPVDLAPGACDKQDDGDIALSALGQIELIDAGAIAVETAEGRTELAPRAFPTVSDAFSGVMYTSRGLASESWPPGTRYRVTTTGTAGVPALDLQADAPRPLSGIALGGVPLAEVGWLAADQPIDVTWAVGAPGDAIWIELSPDDGTEPLVCSFSDESGVATVAAQALGTVGPALVTVHRVRVLPFRLQEGTGLFRFDYAVSQRVVIRP